MRKDIAKAGWKECLSMLPTPFPTPFPRAQATQHAHTGKQGPRSRSLKRSGFLTAGNGKYGGCWLIKKASPILAARSGAPGL